MKPITPTSSVAVKLPIATVIVAAVDGMVKAVTVGGLPSGQGFAANTTSTQ